MKLTLTGRALTWLLGLCLLVLVLMVIRGAMFWMHINEPLKLDTAFTLDVSNGRSLTAIIRELQAEQILSSGNDLLVFAKFSDMGSKIKAGEYELVAGLDAQGLLQLLSSGQVMYHQLRIGEGWTLQQALRTIQQNPAITVTLDPDDQDRLKELFGGELYPEGWFFPDTYNFTKGTTDLDMLRRAKALMETTLAQSWQARDSGLPYASPYEALIMASIVEKETALVSEQSLIAGVFIRRIQRNMRLQTDPTVIYGLGSDFDGNLTRMHLQQDTLWNTYTRRGLPLTPIALPGKGAIEASMHPDQSDYLYFVARGDGSHYFSATLEEHNRAVRQFQLGEQAL